MDGRAGVNLPAGVWFPEEVREMTIFAEQYDFVVSLLLLYIQRDEEPEKIHTIALLPGTGAKFVVRKEQLTFKETLGCLS
jgi:hypothetical protein